VAGLETSLALARGEVAGLAEELQRARAAREELSQQLDTVREVAEVEAEAARAARQQAQQVWLAPCVCGCEMCGCVMLWWWHHAGAFVHAVAIILWDNAGLFFFVLIV
jgi:hypothetical protein